MSHLTLDRFTNRQAAAWPGAVAEAARYVGSIPLDGQEWQVTYAEETRPGRGHHIDASWCDGEHLVQVCMGVYGSPSVSVAAVEWVHSSTDEECECEHCAAERDAEAGGSGVR